MHRVKARCRKDIKWQKKKRIRKINNKRYRVTRYSDKQRRKFPEKYPFWARMKISKNRTTLVIDAEPMCNKTSKKLSNNFVHREATHTKNKRYEKVFPNPDSKDPNPMYLKPPTKMNQRMFKPHRCQNISKKDIAKTTENKKVRLQFRPEDSSLKKQSQSNLTFIIISKSF